MAKRKRKNRPRTPVKQKTSESKKWSSGQGNINKTIPLVMAGIVIIGGLWLVMGSSGNEDNYDDLNLPGYAYTNAVTLKAYGYTILNPEVVEKIPCYCGCEGMGHHSLKNCFISDDGVYSSHASNCDICVGEVIRIKKLYESGKFISEIREIIDNEYGRYGPGNGGVPITEDFNINLKDINNAAAPGVVQTSAPIDYSGLELSPNFRNLEDGLKMTPKGVFWAQFVNMKLAAGTPIENFAADRVQPLGFYGVPLVGMYSADYDSNSWIEFHDIGYWDLGIQPVNQPGMSNVLVTRPFIYGHTYNVEQTRQLMSDPSGMENAYSDYLPVIEAVDPDNAVLSYVAKSPNRYSDMYYSGLADAGSGLVERTLVYHLIPGGEGLTSLYEDRAADSLARGFTQYDVEPDGDILTVIIVGTLGSVMNEEI